MKPEQHPFGTYLNSNSRILILGSFPCFNGSDYGDWFYSGSGRNELWKILSSVFSSKADTREQKIKICLENRIAMADTACVITRTKGNCSDSNLKVLEYNKSGIEKCLKSGISSVFFTGRFAEKHFYRLFPENRIYTLRLPSPSPAADRYIAGTEEYRKMLMENRVSSIYEFKLIKYNNAFKNPYIPNF